MKFATHVFLMAGVLTMPSKKSISAANWIRCSLGSTVRQSSLCSQINSVY